MIALCLRYGRGGEGGEAAIGHFMEISAPLDAVEKKLGGSSVRWSTFDEMDNSVCGKQLERCLVKAKIGMDLNVHRL